MRPKYVSFATPRYHEELDQLQASMHAVGLKQADYYFERRDVQPNWNMATRMKAPFLKGLLEKSFGPIVWLDADARLMRYPILFDQLSCAPDVMQYDIAVHYRTDALGLKLAKTPEGELLSGTIFFEPTEASIELCDRWAKLNIEFPGRWEQKNLQQAINFMPELRVYKLPPEYCMITAEGKSQMGSTEDAVVAHTQASRRLRV